MSDFKNLCRTINNLQNELEYFADILKKSDKEPELLLSENLLPTNIDRVYVLTRLLVAYGEEEFNDFINEYFDRILHVLSFKIPIKDIELSHTYYDDEYVLIGKVDDIPKIIINTFEKTITFLPDENLLQAYEEMDSCQELIYDLERQLQFVSANSSKFAFNKKKHEEQVKSQAGTIIAQLSVEKRNLSNLKEMVNDYEQNNMWIQELLDKFTSRLVNYYHYSIKKLEDSE